MLTGERGLPITSALRFSCFSLHPYACLLYTSSASSAPELFAQADIDGGLVGGASLKADFGQIVNYK